MHASNLLKTVLKPRGVTSSSSGQALGSKDGKSRGTRASTPDAGLASLSVPKKTSPAPKPVKMSCLCAPTNHAGSFRCRLHRGNQQSWGGRPLSPAATPASKPSTATPPKGPSVAPVSVENESMKRIVNQLPTPRQPMMSYAPAHRSTEARPSRLSRVSAATDVEAPVAQAHTPAPAPAFREKNVPTVRYLKFSGGPSCTSGAVIDGGMVFIKKLQTGGKDAMQEVFGSGTALSRAGLSL